MEMYVWMHFFRPLETVYLSFCVGRDAVVNPGVVRVQGHDLGPAGDHERLWASSHLDGHALVVV